MIQISLWQRLMIVAILVCGAALAVPNLFYGRVEAHNDASLALARAETAAGAAVTPTPEQQKALGQWPDLLPSGLVNLGLDLRGGAHLLAEVKVQDVYKSRMDALWPELRRTLAAERATLGAIRRAPAPEGELRVQIGNPEQLPRALELAKTLASPVVTLTGAGEMDYQIGLEGETLSLRLSEAEKAATDKRTVQQSLEIIRRRVDEVGTREPTIQAQGADRILIQVPGIGSAAELKALIGTTAKLAFHPVVSRGSDTGAPAGIGNLKAPSIDEPGVVYILEETPVVTGEELVDARPDFDQNGGSAVSFRFNPAGARKFGDYTANNIGQLFAIVLDNEVISAPVIRDHIGGGSGIISGNFDVTSATNLAVLLRAGALPAELTFLEERTIGPELGQDSIDAGRVAALVGFGLIVAYMIASYGLFGTLASVALVFNVALIFGLLTLIGGTLTLPGIAGIVLTMGMAVDANVLVFERIREELRANKGPARAIEEGYKHAMSAIVDANVTTILSALVLFVLGSGPVRGFAITLMIGILTSVFTAIWVTRLFVVIWFERARPKTIIL